MDSSSGSPPPSTTAAARSRLWLLGLLFVVGSLLLSVVQMATGLHSQLVANRKMVRALREQILEESTERESLLREKDATLSKTATLRTKSKLVTDELLDQQRKAKHLQQELILAREDLAVANKNCTLVSQRMKDRFDVTLRALHDRVIQNNEYRSLLERNVEERAKLESSLAVMQDRAYNASMQLKAAKQKLRDVVLIATKQREDIERLRQELAALKSGGASSSSSSSSTDSDTGSNDSNNNNGNAASEGGEAKSASEDTAATRAWKQHVEPKSGRTYWYNSILKKSQWDKPKELEDAGVGVATTA